MMKLSRNRILLSAYIIGLFVFFLYIGFPSDSIRTYLANRLSNMSPQIRVTIERVKPAFPPGIRLFNVQIYNQDNFWGSIENIKLIPSLLSLFGSETEFSFQGNAYAGEIKGNAEISTNSPAVSMMVDTTLSGVQVKDVEAIQDVSDYNISGILNATIAYTADARNQTVKGTLKLSDSRLELAVPVFNQDLLTFRDVQAEVLLNNQTLTIQRCDITGNQLNASISGSIILNQRTGTKGLNLNANITPHSVLLAELKKSMPLFLLKGGKNAGQDISFKIRGTMEAPEFSLK
jgi:type II secretion system protein N